MTPRYWTARVDDDVTPGRTWRIVFASLSWSASHGDVVFLVGREQHQMLLGWAQIDAIESEERLVVGDDEEANSPPYPTYERITVTLTCKERLTEPVPLPEVIGATAAEIMPTTYEDIYRNTYGGEIEIVPDAIAQTLVAVVRNRVYSRIPAAPETIVLADIFISYAHENLAVAKRICQALTAQGFRPWLDEELLVAGQDWEIEIQRAIRTSRVFIALLSRASVDKRGFVQKELREGIRVLDETPASQIYLIPARIEPCTPYDPRLSKLHWVDLFPEFRAGLDRLLRDVRIAYARSR